MSNNKQSIKLYTEEQVIRIAKLYRHELYVLYAAMKTETPIELPSDEEIEEYADSVMPYAEKIGGETYTAYRAIKLGAKWVCKIIQGGNK